MIEILTLLAFNSLYIFGFYASTDYALDVDKKPDPKDREILWFVKWYGRDLPMWLQKPLFGCVVCMASIHSWPYLFYYSEITLINIVWYFIYIFALSGLNAIINEKLSS